ncbi:TetR/AcrR family transcriptional regulator [Psychrobacillus sp. INOP01]|uniref:TetR/AcrR family transcriptional regulator n=1 Tax=Psychrobacillus sp. INOP01 TaxID=2829187 RepID=UPI001BA9FACE|nr:TetR/AcrR family transcriptional regulator [Psychrobacillus sp. INOP01]QUG40337.1 TetR/AcrR family transcriptional regulator [Psychrobacillus sp. INOP01]
MARERKFTDDELFKSTKLLLIEDGYDSFTFSKLASMMEVSRGSIYKYYENKDELISEFLMYEMNYFLQGFSELDKSGDFQTQFSLVINFIFRHSEIHQILEIIHQIPKQSSHRVVSNQTELNTYYINMYKQFQGLIEQGKKERVIKSHLSDAIILGMIFQTIAIPNHFGIPKDEWVASIKEILSEGMFQKD